MDNFKDQIAKFKEKALPWWNDMSQAKKVAYIAIAGLAIVFLSYFSNTALKTDYQILYRGLDPAEAGEIVDYLSENKVGYKISDGGSAVMVSSGDIQKVRLDLATAGLPRSGIVGYEIFDQSNLGMTEFLQKVNHRRALEGELTKTISRLDEVKSARVHLVVPEERLFKEDKQEPSASVVLYHNRNRFVDERQIEGITYLLSTSVEGLKPENITILDASGKLLSNRRSTNHLASLSSTQLDMKKNVENYLQDKAQSMLDGVLGPNRSIVRVSAELNFDQVEKTSERYDPDNLAIRSEEISEEDNSETENAGADPGQKRDLTNTIKNTIRNYEVNKTIEHLVNEVGNIEQLHVAVSLDGSYQMTKDEAGKEVGQYVPRSEEEIDKIIALIKSTVGYSEKRNDIIEVANLPFETFKDGWEQEQQIRREEQINKLIDIGYRILLMAIAAFVLWKLRGVYQRYKSKHDARRRFLQAQEEIQRKAAEIMPKISKEPRLIDHVRKIADDTPDELSKVVKTMMVE